MMRLRKNLTVGAATWVLLLGTICPSAPGRQAKSVAPPRDEKLVLHPQKISAEAGKYSLLPPPASLVEGDAFPWYEKAAQALPGKKSADQVVQYLKMPIDQLPVDQVEQFLKQYLESFKCAAQAVKCRECKWPTWKAETVMAKNEEYRRLAFAVRLWARLENSRGESEGALLALQTGFGMARQMGQTPNLPQLQMGVASAGVLCREIEQFVQMEDAPNLHSALAALPKPLVDVEKAIKNADDRTRALARKLDSDLAILQCMEAIRSYAASHGGQLPQTLADIKEVSLPNDPMCGAAYRYTRTGATAALESTVPAGGEKRDEVHYQITVKN